MPKKILIVSSSFFPQNSPRSFRTTELAKEFAQQGHEVDVLLPQNLQAEIEEQFDNKLGIRFMYFGPLKWKKLQRSKIAWIGDWKRKFGRLLFLLIEYPNIEIFFKLPKALKKINGYDLMITIAVPHENHWAAAWVHSKKHLIANTWVADSGDPYYLNSLESIKPPFYFSWIEKWASRKVDFISIPFENLRDYFFKEFHAKIRIIPQGFNFEEIQLSKSEPQNRKPTFAYAGGVAKKGVRSPLLFLKLLLGFKEDFEFHIYATTGQELILSFEKESNKRIFLQKPVSREELLPRLAEMDFLVNLLITGTDSKQVPSKLIDYGLTGRPILNIDPVNPNKALILDFLKGNYSKAFIVENLQQYNIRNVAARFLELA